MTISVKPGNIGYRIDNVVTAEIEINTVDQNGNYSGHELSLVVVDDDGNVIEK